MGSAVSQTSAGFVKFVGGSCYNVLMRLRKARERDFGFDAAGRLCELSRADRNRRRRGLPVRTIGARSSIYATPPDVREWHRAFAKLPADVVLFEFQHRGPYEWLFVLGDRGLRFAFGPTDGVGWLASVPAPKTGLVVLGRRKHPRRARALVDDAVRRLPELLARACAPYFPPMREVA